MKEPDRSTSVIGITGITSYLKKSEPVIHKYEKKNAPVAATGTNDGIGHCSQPDFSAFHASLAQHLGRGKYLPKLCRYTAGIPTIGINNFIILRSWA
jgi:hypothetical protein